MKTPVTENEDSYGEFEKRLAEEEDQVLHLVEIFTLQDLGL